MNCQKARRWMSREFDDALSERRQERLNEHLALCAECRAVREQWLRLRTSMKARQPATILSAEAMWSDVRRILRNTAWQEPVRFTFWEHLSEHPLWGWAAGLAAIVAVLSLTYIARLCTALPAAAAGPAVVEFVETQLPGAAPMVYQDDKTGWTVIWVVEANGKESGHAGT